MELLQQAFAPLAVLVLLGGALWFVKTRQGPRFGKISIGKGAARRMQVVERVALTPHHMLCLVRIGERLVMIGTAPSNCQLMQTIEDSRE
jgi:flagellar biogenesis protein FliO